MKKKVTYPICLEPASKIANRSGWEIVYPYFPQMFQDDRGRPNQLAIMQTGRFVIGFKCSIVGLPEVRRFKLCPAVIPEDWLPYGMKPEWRRTFEEIWSTIDIEAREFSPVELEQILEKGPQACSILNRKTSI